MNIQSFIHLQVVWECAYVCVCTYTYEYTNMYNSKYSHYTDAQFLQTPTKLGQHLAMVNLCSVSLKNLKPCHGDGSGMTFYFSCGKLFWLMETPLHTLRGGNTTSNAQKDLPSPRFFSSVQFHFPIMQLSRLEGFDFSPQIMVFNHKRK